MAGIDDSSSMSPAVKVKPHRHTKKNENPLVSNSARSTLTEVAAVCEFIGTALGTRTGDFAMTEREQWGIDALMRGVVEAIDYAEEQMDFEKQEAVEKALAEAAKPKAPEFSKEEEEEITQAGMPVMAKWLDATKKAKEAILARRAGAGNPTKAPKEAKAAAKKTGGAK